MLVVSMDPKIFIFETFIFSFFSKYFFGSVYLEKQGAGTVTKGGRLHIVYHPSQRLPKLSSLSSKN